MITVNDKLHLFTKRIIERRQLAYDVKVHELEDKMVEELHERKTSLVKDRVKYETSLLKGIKSERSQRLSNARSEKKRRLLLKRKNMIETLLDGVKEYTKSFVESKDYPAYLKKMFTEHAESIQRLGDFDVYLNKRDLELMQGDLKNLFDSLNLKCLSFKCLETPMIGGAILLKEDGTSRIDLSLDSVIEDNKTYMGQLIYGILEEAGEISGKQS